MEEKIELPKGIWNEVAKYKEIKSFNDNPKYELKDEFKYFTPSIENIRVGYECELFWNQDFLSENFWDKIIIGDNGLEDINWYARIAEKTIRTPYLTKEQIGDEEGIDELQFDLSSKISYRKNNHWLHYNFNKRILSIIPIDPVKEEGYWEVPRFIGIIPCINEFRYIIKLLKI